VSNGLRHHNGHDRNHLLVQALKKVLVDHIKHQQTDERPDYSFEEWEYIFCLLGALEPSSGEYKESGDRKRMIDWLHSKNPLNATEKLTEWLLLTLVEKLEGELLDLRRKMGNTAVD
jgi:potassium channel subfamily K, other eukaryote